jgi:tetratricopeptide (TPR) repeat protein
MFDLTKKLVIAATVAVVGLSAGAGAQSTKTIYLGQDMNIERGMNALRSGDLDGALKHLRRAARADIGTERLVPVLSNICAIEYAQGNLDAAEEACDRAIGEDRSFWRAYVNRGNVYKARGDYTAAKADYERAAQIDRNDLSERALASLEASKDKLVAEAK